jgi:hypothetical protein
MGQRGQINGPARHDYQAGEPCLGRGTRVGRARPDYPSGPGRAARLANYISTR